MTSPKNWHKDNFFVSTDKSLLQPEAINAALKSDILWWARELSLDQLKLMLDNTLCFGLYDTSSSNDSSKQIGLARLITDYVTFAYMTDVYVLPEYQGKGLGKWMMGCINEVLDALPHLRGFMLISGSEGEKFYGNLFGVRPLTTVSGHEVKALIKDGPGR